MTPQQFIDKWRSSTLTERAGSQSHFKDLCRLLGEPEPYADDASDAAYAFEKGATKTGGGDGWADVWKRGCFGWEYKGKRKDLGAALKQLKLYQGALENPPLLIVSDMETIEIHTAFTSMVQERHVFTLDDLKDAGKRALLKKAFSETGVETFKPGRKRADVTADVAREFIVLAQNLRERKHPPEAVAHFVNRMVFCMFAEDVDLLPNRLFTKLLERSLDDPERFKQRATQLFEQMKGGGELADFTKIEWFNGGLFDDGEALPLERADIKLALNAAKQDWANIDPSIMGTLFERGLDPDKRSQLGAHYTDPEKIMMIVRPVIVEPLTREWDAVKAQITALLDAAPKATKEKLLRGAELAARTKALNKAEELHRSFVDKLKAFRILDPACGSGNFLFLGLKALKDIEHRVNTECEALGLPRGFPGVGPENMLGIEINPFAAELARVSVWIGEIQWMREHGFDASRDPILKPLNTIVCHDALLDDDCGEYKWPDSDVIIGNPPYLGAKLMKRKLGQEETEKIRAIFASRLPGFTDLVCYWFEKAREKIEKKTSVRAGLVATNSIRKNTNLPVMKRILETTRIFEAWNEERWTIGGAAVDVSLICFGGDGEVELKLNGAGVDHINADLTTGIDLTLAKPLSENTGAAFLGIQKSGPFDVPGGVARAWMREAANPNRRKNAVVLKPYWNGDDLTGRPRDMWLIDLPLELSEDDAALFVSPFNHIAAATDENGQTIRELRLALGERAGPRWWEPLWPRPEMRKAIASLRRYLVTPETAEHRIFIWLSPPILPDKNLIVIPRDDDVMFGLLHSRIHEVWSLRKGSDLQDRPRYTHTSTFATFPLPKGLTPDIPVADYANDARAKAIARSAAKLNELRENWLNPEDLIRREPEVVPGYPDRIVPVNEAAAKELKKRTLTSLYNQRPAWLENAHRDLDAAVAAAYGWKDWSKNGLPDEEILARLFKLNQERAAAGR